MSPANTRSEPTRGGAPAQVDDQGRDLLGRLLDDPDLRVRRVCSAALLWIPADTAYGDW